MAESAVVEAIAESARAETVAAARRLAAIAELVHQTVDEDDARGGWACDPWAATAAQIGAALGVSTRRASAQMRIAVALRDRLPAVAALFAQGLLSVRVVSETTWRTALVTDESAATVDAAIARAGTRWGALSDEKLARAIDAVVERYDPDAVKRAKEVIASRDIRFGAHDDPNEIVAGVELVKISVYEQRLISRCRALVGLDS